MLKFLAFGFGVGLAIQSWRNFPADGPVAPEIAMMGSVVAIAAAYYGGRARRRPVVNLASAVASAQAASVASNQVNVAVVVPGGGAGSGRHSAVAVPTESAGWFAGPREAITSDMLDGMDFADLDVDRDVDTQTSHN